MLNLMKIAATALMLTVAGGALAAAESAKDARVYFITPQDGETVTGPVSIKFGLSGMGVAPAGVERANTGHHHLIIDAPLPSLDQSVPSDEHYRHFGGGQTETTIELAPGEHTLQLLMGDQLHRPHSSAVFSDVITITVK